MRSKQVHPRKKQKKYRNYDHESLALAFKAWQDGMTVYKAAKYFGVPEQTLRDRARGLIKVVVDRSGPPSLLSEENEQMLCDHVKKMALFGYGYSYFELRMLATDTAIFAGKLAKNAKILSEMWLNRFLKRHPNLKGLKPRSLSMVRAKAVSASVVDGYYTKLESVLTKYNLHGKPSRIFNIDETGITPEHRPPNIVGPTGMTAPAITSGRSNTTTVIACCSATGQYIPPYFVFKGKRFSEELLRGASTGTGYCMSDKGWSNSEVFNTYVTEHLSQHIPGGIGSEYTLILYDGASSHFSPSLIEWALANKVVLMVLPAHSSHLLQPLDVGVFKPFKSAYNKVCQEFMPENVGRQITRYDICELACKAYIKALTPSNIMNSFKKTGIVPLNRNILNPESFMPNEITTATVQSQSTEQDPVTTVSTVSSFLKRKIPKLIPPLKKTVSSKIVTSGKEITNLTLAETIVAAKKKKEDVLSNKNKFVTPVKHTTPEPGPSGLQKQVDIHDSSSDSDSEESQSDKCCVCMRFYVNKTNADIYISLTSWGQCDAAGCGHWVHLKYCTPTSA